MVTKNQIERLNHEGEESQSDCSIYCQPIKAQTETPLTNEGSSFMTDHGDKPSSICTLSVEQAQHPFAF